MKDLAARVLHLFPNADLDPLSNKVMLQDDGDGAYIKHWDNSLGVQPSEAALNAVTAQQITEAIDKQRKIKTFQGDKKEKARAKWLMGELAKIETATGGAYKAPTRLDDVLDGLFTEHEKF